MYVLTSDGLFELKKIFINDTNQVEVFTKENRDYMIGNFNSKLEAQCFVRKLLAKSVTDIIDIEAFEDNMGVFGFLFLSHPNGTSGPHHVLSKKHLVRAYKKETMTYGIPVKVLENGDHREIVFDFATYGMFDKDVVYGDLPELKKIDTDTRKWFESNKLDYMRERLTERFRVPVRYAPDEFTYGVQ